MKLINRGDKTLNIFCDASITDKKHTGPIVTGCAGATMEILDKKGYTMGSETITKIIPETTNNNSELSAVLLGIQLAIKYKDQVDAINLFSDSKITIFGLREWIFNWVNNIEEEQLLSSTGSPVANQEIICQILNYIIYNNLDIQLFHQKGHVANTKASVFNAIHVFKESNNIELSEGEMIIISDFNNFIDRHTGDVLERYTNNGKCHPKKMIRPIEFPLQLDHIQLYKQLIGRN